GSTRGSTRQTSSIPAIASGTFTKNTACQPPTMTSTPPITGPSAADAEFETLIAPSPAAGLRPSSIEARTSTTAEGNAADVPAAWASRSATNHPKPGQNGVSTDTTSTTSR